MGTRLGSAYVNEDGQIVHLSSASYVPVRIRSESGPWTALRIRTPRFCDDSTVCIHCAEGWTWDWDFGWDRTIGGRRLREAMVAEGYDPDAWQRWDNDTATPDDAARSKRGSELCGRPPAAAA